MDVRTNRSGRRTGKRFSDTRRKHRNAGRDDDYIRPLLVDVALRGYGAPASGFYTPAISWAYNPTNRAPAFDLNAAANLLDQAELEARDGARLNLPFAPLVENVQFVVARANVTGLPHLQARGLVTFNDYRLVRVKK
jgi:ABC-type transport system substrate-binding protein